MQSALLRNELIRLRKDSGLTQEQVAQPLDWSASKLIRMEGGRCSIISVDLNALLSVCGTLSESVRERLQADAIRMVSVVMVRMQRQAKYDPTIDPQRQYHVVDKTVIR